MNLKRKLGKVLPLFIYEFIQKNRYKMRKLSRLDNVFTDKEWLRYVLSNVRTKLEQGNKGVVLLGAGKLSVKLQRSLLNNYYNKRLSNIYVMNIPMPRQEVQASSDSRVKKIVRLSDIDEDPEQIVIVVCCTSNFCVTKALEQILKEHRFETSELIYLIRVSQSYPSGTRCVSSVFDAGLIEEVYKFSLTKLTKSERKCGLVHAYDLCQLLLQTRQTEGAIAEFGSFHGHSGLITTEFIKRLGIQKQIYLCDTFSGFPVESLGIDRFWSNTQHVDYEKVKQLFKDYNNVHLVCGDFKETIDTIPEEKFSLIYVDCDSYRAVKLVSEKTYPKLSSGGISIYADYGYIGCLGARFAVDEFYENKKDCRCFFSGFSGFSIVIKL